MITLTLPYPPSSNRLWRSVNGRNIKSAEYRKWETACSHHLLEHRIQLARTKPLAQPYSIRYVAQRPDRRARDVENLPKALGDMLQTLGVIEDDAYCFRSTVEWAVGDPVGRGALVTIEIMPT